MGEKMINRPSGNQAAQRGRSGDCQSLSSQRGEVVDDLPVRPDSDSQKEQQQENGIGDRFPDLLEQLDTPQQVPYSDSPKHDTDNNKHTSLSILPRIYHETTNETIFFVIFAVNVNQHSIN